MVSVADAASYVLASTSSELLSASDAAPYTKYQSLFLGDASGEEARRKFFLRLSHHQRQTLDIFLQDFPEEDIPHATLAIVTELRRAADRRYKCFALPEKPPCFTDTIAWRAYRSAILDERYWLAPEEASLFAALASLRLQVVSSTFAPVCVSNAPLDFEEVVVLLRR